jgi:ADP-ribose pyrophosphatase YjhB (NUDIX family)
MGAEPRIRVSAILRWRGRVLLCRHEKPGREYWLLPGGGVNSGESLVAALHRELREEVGIADEIPLEGPVAIVDSIAPERSFAAKHVVHIIFAGDLGGRSRTQAVRPRRARDRRPAPADPPLPITLAARRPPGLPRRFVGPLTPRKSGALRAP